MSEAWPFLALAGLGVYHGLNPAMGWLFAVALGLHRRSYAVVLQAMVPLALGHALAVTAVAMLVVAAGHAVDTAPLRALGGGALILWALYHLAYGSRHRARVGMQAGFAGLLLWSFLMAGAHGAGLMLIPALIPLCLSPLADPSPGMALLAVGIHTAAMLAVTALVATLVYEVIGVAFLRRGWLNLDRLWTAALAATGLVLVIA